MTNQSTQIHIKSFESFFQNPFIFIFSQKTRLYHFLIKNYYNMYFLILIAGNIILSTIILILSITSLAVSNWVSQGESSKNWSGGLLSKSNTFYTNLSCNLHNKHTCEGYMKLWKAGVIYLSFELLSITLMCIFVFILVKVINRINIKKESSIILSLGAAFAHTFGFVAWFVMVNPTFGDKCKVIFRDDANANVCAKDGPAIGLSLFILHILSILYSSTVWIYLQTNSYLIDSTAK